MKMPSDSRVAVYDASRSRSREALAVLAARGEEFSVPAFTEALGAILAREAARDPGAWRAPWKG